MNLMLTGNEPAYLQLYRALREKIISGAYPTGARLPSKRLLAGEAGVSLVTVEHALAILSDEGYIRTAERSGCFVIFRAADFGKMSGSADYKAENGASTGGQCEILNTESHKTQPVGGYISSDGAESHKTQCVPGDIPPKGAESRKTQYIWGDISSEDAESRKTQHIGGDISSEDAESHKTQRVWGDIARKGGESALPEPAADFPFSVFARTMRRVLSEYGEEILIKSPNRGRPELQRAISEYLARNRGISVPPARIVIGSGADYLYGLCLQLLGRDRLFAIESPSYEKIREVYTANGVRFEELPMGEDGILTPALAASRASVLHTTPYRSFPTGVTAGASKRQEYLQFAAERGGFIIEDDFDSEFTVSRKMEDTLYALSGGENVLYLNTFSRTVAPAVRVGYMVLPGRLSPLFEEKLGFYSCTVPTFEQLVLAHFISDGDFERHVNRVRRKRREALAAAQKMQDSKTNFAKMLDKTQKV